MLGGDFYMVSPAKEERPSYLAVGDPKKRLVDEAALLHAKAKELLPPVIVKLLGRSMDLTIDEATVFEKQVALEGLRGRNTIRDLKERLLQENLAAGHPRVFLPPHELSDETKLGECHIQWTGFGLDNWPPKFVVKPQLQGFEMVVNVPASSSTAVWETVKGKRKLQKYASRQLIFDLLPETSVMELKGLIEHRLGIPAARQLLSAEVAGEFFLEGHTSYLIDLEDASTMQEHGIDRFGHIIHFRINR
ncbi:unnamed protein product, partial [Effrenium voratum]